MKAREIGQRLLMCFLMLCIVCGILLMMCESDDWNIQKWTLLGGFGLFLLGALPCFAISVLGERKHGYSKDI